MIHSVAQKHTLKSPLELKNVPSPLRHKCG